MPDLDWNAYYWARGYDWSGAGEEWSEPWGSSAAQWYATLLPRIRAFLPAATILEIAPGFGRWTRFLGPMCQRYQGVDLSPTCVASCRERFPFAHMEFLANDGTSLAGVPDGSVDLAFSFDSLVHADAAVLRAYVPQVLSKLTGRGAAFIHHSNLADLHEPEGELHARDPGVGAGLVEQCVSQAGGQMLLQEIVKWQGVDGLDCISSFSRPGAFDATPAVVANGQFMDEAAYIRSYVAPWGFRRRP